MSESLVAALLVIVVVSALAAVVLVVRVYGQRFDTLLAGERRERAELLRAVLARTPAEFVAMDRTQGQARAKVLAAQRIVDDIDPREVDTFSREVREMLEAQGLDLPPEVVPILEGT